MKRISILHPILLRSIWLNDSRGKRLWPLKKQLFDERDIQHLNKHDKSLKHLNMAETYDSGSGPSISGANHRGQPNSWTLVREGFIQPIFSLQKHMPEICVGRSTDCTLSCPGKLARHFVLYSFCAPPTPAHEKGINSF